MTWPTAHVLTTPACAQMILYNVVMAIFSAGVFIATTVALGWDRGYGAALLVWCPVADSVLPPCRHTLPLHRANAPPLPRLIIDWPPCCLLATRCCSLGQRRSHWCPHMPLAHRLLRHGRVTLPRRCTGTRAPPPSSTAISSPPRAGYSTIPSERARVGVGVGVRVGVGVGLGVGLGVGVGLGLRLLEASRPVHPVGSGCLHDGVFRDTY